MTLSETDSPRWRRRPEHRPEEILDAAMDMFAQRGLAGARVEDIAEAAGISKGTLYLYFESKEELFKEAVRSKVHRTLEDLSAAAPPGGNPTDRLDRFITAYWAHLRRPAFGNLYRLLLAELHQFPELSRFYSEEVSGRTIELVREIIADGTARGSFQGVAAAVAARMLVGVMVQHAVWTSRRELFPHLGGRSDDALVQDIKDFVFSALGRYAAGASGESA